MSEYLRPETGGRSTVFGTEGTVACEHPQAALAGIQALDAGGTAADACVAMAAAMAVLAPMMTGMGGDAFLLHYEAGSGHIQGLNGSGRAPRAATIEKARALGHEIMPLHGGLPVTVPGAVRMWDDANAALGRLPLATLLEPARCLAERGFPVPEVTARYWREAEALLNRNAAAAKTFLPEGRAPSVGEIFRQPELAKTLAAVADDGARVFYTGKVAERIVRVVQEAGGVLEEEDLATHESLWVEPISTGYRGISVHEIPPPGQGITVLEMLNILEGFDLSSLDPSGAERIHLEAEAKKLAYEDLHTKIGDPEFSEIPTSTLLSKEYAAGLHSKISSSRIQKSAGAGLAGGDTTYLCAVDRWGNGCSFINSLYKSFGSGVVAAETGICLQNRGNSFRLASGHPNALAPGKRPMHTIIPGLATQNGALWATFGVMGGFMQPQGQAQLLANLLDYEMSPQEAVDHPRHFHDAGTLLVEGRIREKELRKLRELGHRVEVAPGYAIPTGGAQLIRVLENGVRACGSDPRKDGCALAQ